MSKKHLYEEVKYFIEIESNSGCKLKSINYNNLNENLEIECKCGNTFYTPFKSFRDKNKRQCNECRNNLLREKFKIPKEDIELYVSQSSYKFIEWVEEHKNSFSKFKVVCKNGHEWVTGFSNFKNHECPKCQHGKNKQMQKYDVEFIRNKFIERGLIPLFNTYENCSSDLEYKCPKHPEHIQKMNWNRLRDGQGCAICSLEMRTGENSIFWKGGVRNLQEFLRSKISQWKIDSLKFNKYTCFIREEHRSDLVIHHLYNFNKILYEIIDITKLPIYQNVGLYTEDKLKILVNTCIELHYKYGYGITISEDLHKLFHKLYGKKDNTYEQLLEFKQRYKSGEFNEIREQNVS